MKIAIMQPYFFPYIGYWQLINAVDKFVVYDNIKYTKKGWINRNQLLLNGSNRVFTLPIKKDSDYLNINERYIADTWPSQKIKLLNLIKCAYSKAPEFKRVMPLIEECLNISNNNLFEFLHKTIKNLASFLNIKTEVIVSSSLHSKETLRSQSRVIDICRELKASEYINPQGGVELYQPDAFKMYSIDLKFLFSTIDAYKQYNNQFIPHLSIIDVLMFNGVTEIKNLLNQFTLKYK